MDEEEELENTLIGQQEEAPAVNTEGALMGNVNTALNQEVSIDPAPKKPGFFEPGGFGFEYLGPRLGENIGQFAGEQLYGTGITAEGQATGFPVDRPSLAGDILTLPGTALNVAGDFFTDPLVASGKLVKNIADYTTGATGVQAQQDAQAPSGASALVAPPSVTSPVERPTASAQDQPPAAVSPFLQSPNTPSGLGGPLLRGFEMVNDAARGPNAPMGQDATRARLGGMTLNEYLNAPASTPGVSGLRTDPQGRMISSPAPAVVNNFAPQAPSGQVRDALFREPPQQGAVPAFSTGPATPPPAFSTGPNVDPGFIQPPSLRDPDEGFTPRPPSLRDSDEGFIRPVPNLSDFERESLAREARLAARPDFNEVRRDRDRRGGISQSDARDLAQGMDRRATEGERARALEIQSRLGLGQFKPEREPTELEKREIESRIRARDADIAQGERKADFEPRIVDIGDQRAMELAPGYFQRIVKDTPQKSGLQKTLEFLQTDLDSGRLTQEQYDIAVRNAKNLYIGLKEPKQNEIDVQKRIDEIREEKMGAVPAEGTDASDTRSFDTEAEAKASGVKGEVLIGGRRAVIE